MSVNYDSLARDYVNYRVPDWRIESIIRKHLIPGAKVLNVGAGQGAYEPEDCDVTAIEPSSEMIARRPERKAQAILGFAERLPFADDSFDVSLAILTIHHLQDIQKGLSEIKRVTRGRVVILTWNGNFGDFWLPHYLPEIASVDRELFPTIDKVSRFLGGSTDIEVVEIPYDCTDGFMCAYWRRPEMYLKSDARKAISTFSRLGDTSEGLNRLRHDIDSGLWYNTYASLLTNTTLDCGYRLVVHDKNLGERGD